MTRYRRMNRPDGKKELDGDIVVDRPPLVIEGTKTPEATAMILFLLLYPWCPWCLGG
jgi:hypothetical protein